MEEKGSKPARVRRATGKSTATGKSAAAGASPKATAVAPVKTAVKKPAAPPKPSPAQPAGLDRAERVRIAAYFRAERRGFVPGYETEDWLAAEAEVAAETREPAKAAPRTTAARKPTAG
jgi:hypothetical protein